MTRIKIIWSAGVIILVLGITALAQTGKFERIGVGTPPPEPGESLHVVNGNILLNSTDERGVIVRRFGSQFAFGPKFTLGRIALGGDGDPNFRVFYDDEIGRAHV